MGGGGDFQIPMPYSMLEPIRELLDAGVQSDVSEKDERWAISLREDIKSATVMLSSTLTSIEMNLSEVVNFKKGDILPFDMPDQVVLEVENVPVFRGDYGVSRGNMAIKINEQIERPFDPAQVLALPEVLKS